MTTIKVPDMMCENCVKRITNALTAAELTFRVDLAAKNVTIDGCENYGAVLSDIINAAANKYIGIVCANTNKKTIAIRNCKIGAG